MPVALTRQPAQSLVQCEVSHVERKPIDFSLAVQQHQNYCRTLQQHGLDVQALPPDESYPDSVFVEDNAIVLDEIAVLTTMGAVSRQGEPALLKPILSGYRKVVEIALPARIEGGDVFRVGKALYVGCSTRTNHEGIEALRRVAGPFGYVVHPIEVHGCLHLKTACSLLDDETLLVNSAWIDVNTLRDFRLLPVPVNEPVGANVLRVGQGILANASYPATIKMLETRGYEISALDISEFSKAEAGLTCLSLIIEDFPSHNELRL